MPVKLTSKEPDLPVEDPIVEEEVRNENFDIKLPDGRVLYTTDQEELDDCFYGVLALASWSKTFVVSPKLTLTFSTITEEEKMESLENIRSWAEKNSVSSQMFDQYNAKINLLYYLSTIEVAGSTINLRSLPVDKRFENLSKMAEQAINFYSLYQGGFSELVRRSLLSNSTLKNS